MQECKIPQNITAEQNVLSAMLIGAKVIDKVAEILKPEDFYRPSHRIIYQVMLALHTKEQPVDLITVIEELKRRNKLDDVGGVNYVTLLGELAVTAANVEWHAKIVADEAVLRQVAEGCNEIASLACGGNGKSPREILGMMEQKVLGLTAQNHSNGLKQLRDAIGENMDAMSRQLERHETVTGLPTGFPQLDHLTGGLHPSDFIILAARPSMGKTSLGLNITENVALRGAKEGEAPKRVVLFSLEMSRNQLVKRMIRTEAEVGEEELCPHRSHASFAPAQPEADAQEMEVLDRLWTASDKLAGASVFIDDTPGLTLQELRSKARKLKTEGGLDLIVIDYLQLMRGTTQHGGFENRQHEVSAISRGLKALARELNVPVLALSQLSRSVENRQEKRPMLSDLRESGSLEQDADIVLFLYREDYYKNTWKEALHPTELIIAKHRNGPTGKIDLFFKSDCTKFIGLDEEAV
ncbi:replicative DNA helicase [uncultured Succiniclasticum sp.]|uniref:replicative DNA helicase n=1 Tax=uncultured Succiniclasticum sp. TaxID=1500547 RepID=UPI0025FBCB84|nr:replicative DNA helicase [uncultured Succiniclasticum sp.]